jgi:hypothetical protein
MKIGLPALEKKWPWVVPIADAILKLIGGKTAEPSENLMASAEHYNALCSGGVCKPDGAIVS